jgi:hypothetical protein
MTNDQKKDQEVSLCQSVAQEINKKEGTDYRAEPGTSEPADVCLVSSSKTHPPRSVQVVTIPHDLSAREDNSNIHKLKHNLLAALRGVGLSRCIVRMLLSEKTIRYGLKQELTETLARVIVQEGEDRNVQLRGTDLYAFSPELAKSISLISVLHSPHMKRLDVQVDLWTWGPRDGRWIEEAINLKLAKYGGPQAVEDLTLVIGALAFVDREQIKAFQETNPPDTLPFAEIWIVSPIEGTLALKRRQTLA